MPRVLEARIEKGTEISNEVIGIVDLCRKITEIASSLCDLLIGRVRMGRGIISSKSLHLKDLNCWKALPC